MVTIGGADEDRLAWKGVENENFSVKFYYSSLMLASLRSFQPKRFGIVGPRCEFICLLY